ncbi:MAG TPA: hypothetical protein PKO06_25135, partial [Candidatus Ozemobacteraceae bacterium]|nr:hypothetical protein [Candidatus Ozemobacteraceae bacterium]
LVGEIVKKVYDTLAALVPASVRANDSSEQQLARSMVHASDLRVVLHLEQPAKHSKLFPRVYDPNHIYMKLKQLLKPIDPHPFVVETNRMGSLHWEVSS